MWKRRGRPRPAAGEKIPFRRSLQLKFALTYMVIIAAVLVLLNTYPVLASQDLVFRSKTNLLQSQAAVIANSLARTATLTADTVRDYVEGSLMTSMDDMGQMRVLVTDPSGLVLYDSDDLRDMEGEHALFSELSAALHGWDVANSAYRDGAFRSRAAIPVMYRGMIIGAVYLYEVDSDQARLLDDIQTSLGTVSVGVCGAVLVMSVVFSRALTRRVGDMLQAIRQVREGEYSHRIPLQGHDELSQLASEFNELTGRLQTTEEVRRRFVSDASHELKTPLASIRLLTDSISEKLLTLTRMDSGVPAAEEPVDCKAVVEKVAHMLSPLAAESGVALELDLEEGCMVLATGDDLYQIAFNLMENAVKYNVRGGKVITSLCRRGDLVLLTVEDTGVGIPEEDLPKIFDRFYRVDKARSRAAGGTGLGLSIVRDTARQHGGAVSVRRREPVGTCFQVAFPRWYDREVEL